MRASGRVQRALWRSRAQLRKSAFLREIVRRIRSLRPDTRDRHLSNEVGFWRRWLASEGLIWPEDYAMRFDPCAPVQNYLARVIDQLGQSSVEILDVGAGPVTRIGKIYSSSQIAITATDPLAREYQALLAEFGLTPPVRTELAEAEHLRAALGSRRFDIVHAVNSLDHAADPVAGIEEMLALTKPGGFVVLLHEENEGAHELYHALHKWDFACERGRFVIAGPGAGGPRQDMTEGLAGRAEVECSTRSGEVLVIIRKRVSDGDPMSGSAAT